MKLKQARTFEFKVEKHFIDKIEKYYERIRKRNKIL